MRGSSEVGEMGTMLEKVSGVPSSGQNPASFGYERWHLGQLFIAPSSYAQFAALSWIRLRLRRDEVDEPVAAWTLLQHRFAAQSVEQLRRQRHVARLARPVRRLRDADALLGA